MFSKQLLKKHQHVFSFKPISILTIKKKLGLASAVENATCSRTSSRTPFFSISNALPKYSFKAAVPQKSMKKMVKFHMHVHTQHCGQWFQTLAFLCQKTHQNQPVTTM